jgi:hypothetical protein
MVMADAKLQAWAGLRAGDRKVTLRIGTTAPDLEAATTAGRTRFARLDRPLLDHPVLACQRRHPPQVASICAYMAKINLECDKPNGKIIGIGAHRCDRHDDTDHRYRGDARLCANNCDDR